MLNAVSQAKSADGSLPVVHALRIAWFTWSIMLVAPFLLFIYAIWQLTDNSTTSPVTMRGQAWFITSCIYLLIAVPVSFFVRSKLFRAYWTGSVVQPEKYLFGMITVWTALEIGGILSITGCLVTHALLPAMIPALVAFMFFVTFFPTGRAMTRPVGHSEDPSTYEEPS